MSPFKGTPFSWLLNVVPDSNENKKVIVDFWGDFYSQVRKSEWFLVHSDMCSEQGYPSEYKDEVMKILYDYKKNPKGSLYEIQLQIENLTMKFDEESIYKTCSGLIKIMVQNTKSNAKDYLYNALTSDRDKKMISKFGHYTIEAIIVYVLSMLYTTESNTLVRLASLVDQLEQHVRAHGILILRNEKKDMDMEDHTLEIDNKFPIGRKLVEFMAAKELIGITSDKSPTANSKKKKGHYYLDGTNYVICKFDLSLLPIKFNLPMVCKPLDWERVRGDKDQPPRFLSDLKGGYLSGLGDNICRYNLISSNNLNHYYINIDENYQKLCNVMNKLQGQAFIINKSMLDTIDKNYEYFVDSGLLMPKFLNKINIKDIYNILRECYTRMEKIKDIYSFNDLLHILQKDIQRARYEKLLIKLASAYCGYKFYLPAFLDFRGRIYRSGLLHFHEGDLARSLILFADKREMTPQDARNAVTGAAFHYKSFKTYDEALDWLKNYCDNALKKCMNNSDILELCSKAKNPFQFLSSLLPIARGGMPVTDRMKELSRIPVTQDASASAYQIMSYLLLDNNIAYRTNLFSLYNHEEIHDIYSYIRDELIIFIRSDESIDENLANVLEDKLNRKLVKSIFMPIIYGKTLMSTASDLRTQLSQFITTKESYLIASCCYRFWKKKYCNMDCLIRLIQNIGWVVSRTERGVVYKVEYFQTVQDYMKMIPVSIWIYSCDNNKKKRRKVTLRVTSDKRDRRKTETSTFVNFIHQRDASLAMKVVEGMIKLNDSPIYTVHDNFISTSYNCRNLPGIYNHAFSQMGPPLSIINEFIYHNIISHTDNDKDNPKKIGISAFKECIICDKLLEYYLDNLKPSGMSKKDEQTWNKRVETILFCYDSYTTLVCDSIGEKSFKDHQVKYEEFNRKIYDDNMLNLSKIDYERYPNYSLHY